jgi:hypothetical protein
MGNNNNNNNNNKMRMKTNNRDTTRSPDAERREFANKKRPGKSTNEDRSEKNTRARMGNNNGTKMRMETNNRDTAKSPDAERRELANNCAQKAPTRIELRRIRELEWATTTTR